MIKRIGVDQVQKMQQQGAQIVEVLAAKEYEEEHLPGAINIPLLHMNATTVSGLDRKKPVIVYCWDYQCDLSPRAAARLESMGFADVYDYAAGKADWIAMGLPTEHTDRRKRIEEVARQDAPTCGAGDRVQSVRENLPAGWDLCVVLNADRIVLGLVDFSQQPEPDKKVEDVMRPAPLTYRPGVTVEEACEKLKSKDIKVALVTTSVGVFIGVLRTAETCK